MSRRDPYAALRYPEFRRLTSASFLVTFAVLVQEVVIAYELYLITRDPLALGLVGLAEAIPFISLVLFGGYLADRMEKRRLMKAALAAILIGSALLIWAMLPAQRATLEGRPLLAIIYGSFFLLGLARGIYSPAASSLKAFLVPRAVYPNSSTWSSVVWQGAAVLGPAAGGLLYAAIGLVPTLLVVFAALLLAFIQVARLSPRRVPAGEITQAGLWRSLQEGFRYVHGSKILLYSITLDMVAVFFGGVVAILPVFVEEILRVGPEELGLLRAAPSVGAILTMLVCAFHPPTSHAWRNMLLAAAGFGLATLAFALSTHIWFSAAMLLLTGAFDSVSVIIRQTLLQLLPPDHLRGRVLAVNSIFVTSSNELGAFESGLAAKLLGTVPSVLLGASLTLATTAGLWRRGRDLFAVRLHL